MKKSLPKYASGPGDPKLCTYRQLSAFNAAAAMHTLKGWRIGVSHQNGSSGIWWVTIVEQHRQCRFVRIDGHKMAGRSRWIGFADIWQPRPPATPKNHA